MKKDYYLVREESETKVKLTFKESPHLTLLNVLQLLFF
jgi:hypothetical protein